MKKYSNKILLFFITLLIIILITSNTISACTGFTSDKNHGVYVGHNKDWWSPDINIHVYPADENKNARLFFEIPYPHIFNSDYHVLAGGINDKGLCFESFVTPFKLASFSLFKPPLFKNPVDFCIEYFSTVQEVIDYIESHNLFFLNYILCSGQIFVVDSTGDAAIIEGDNIIRKQGDYQICTNFLHSDPQLGGYPCWRYQKAQAYLINMSGSSVSYFRTILDAVHQEYYTQYSWIYDMNNEIVHIFHYYNYSNGIQFDLKEKFQQEAHSYYLPSLFEPSTNQAPDIPCIPEGPAMGVVNTEYIFETDTKDKDNTDSEIYYKWDFGDGIQTSWLLNRPPYWGKVSHTWKKSGTYQIKVKARDIYGKESLWSGEFQTQISKTKSIPLLDIF